MKISSLVKLEELNGDKLDLYEQKLTTDSQLKLLAQKYKEHSKLLEEHKTEREKAEQGKEAEIMAYINREIGGLTVLEDLMTIRKEELLKEI